MGMQWEELGPEGLAFFGRICASVSHELKNSLALINENAGLMQDLLVLVDRGQPLDPQRVGTSMERIARHVERANTVLGNLNRFAHLTDEPLRELDLGVETALALRLHQRLASQAQVELVLESGADGVRLATMPFLLGNALHLCIRSAIAVAQGGRVAVTVRSTDQGGEVLFAGLPSDAQLPQGEHTQALLAALSASCTMGSDGMSLTLKHLSQETLTTQGGAP